MKGTCCIVKRNHHYLVQKRLRQDKFVIEFPCSKVEENETFEQAAIRELREETGLEAKVCGDVVEIFANQTSRRSLKEHESSLFLVVLPALRQTPETWWAHHRIR